VSKAIVLFWLVVAAAFLAKLAPLGFVDGHRPGH
jgi:hypothetical protein